MLLRQVNYHASNEYEAIPNYKVLQQGFTAITLTRVRRADVLLAHQHLYWSSTILAARAASIKLCKPHAAADHVH